MESTWKVAIRPRKSRSPQKDPDPKPEKQPKTQKISLKIATYTTPKVATKKYPAKEKQKTLKPLNQS
jgi:hypothetical protein